MGKEGGQGMNGDTKMSRPGQFSLASLFVVTMIGLPMALGLGLHSYRAAASIAWSWPLAWWIVSLCGLFGIGLLLAVFRR